jgi:hypothetical protein
MSSTNLKAQRLQSSVKMMMALVQLNFVIVEFPPDRVGAPQIIEVPAAMFLIPIAPVESVS